MKGKRVSGTKSRLHLQAPRAAGSRGQGHRLGPERVGNRQRHDFGAQCKMTMWGPLFRND